MRNRVRYLCKIENKLVVRDSPLKHSCRFILPEEFRFNPMEYLAAEGIVEYRDEILSDTVVIQNYFLTKKGENMMSQKKI